MHYCMGGKIAIIISLKKRRRYPAMSRPCESSVIYDMKQLDERSEVEPIRTPQPFSSTSCSETYNLSGRAATSQEFKKKKERHMKCLIICTSTNTRMFNSIATFPIDALGAMIGILGAVFLMALTRSRVGS